MAISHKEIYAWENYGRYWRVSDRSFSHSTADGYRPVRGTRYVLGTEADRLREERDKLLELVKAVSKWSHDGRWMTADRLPHYMERDLDAAIAECEKGD